MANTASLTLEQIQKIGRRDRAKRTTVRYMFVGPALFLFFLFPILPLAIGTFYSLTDYNMIQDWTWAGLRNYKTLFLDDDLFLIALQNTLVYAICTGPTGFLMAFGFAWIITNLKAKKFFTLCFYTPTLASGVMMSTIWMFFFANDNKGLFNFYLLKWGIITEPVLWTQNVATIMPVIIFISLMMSMGNSFLVFLAGLQNIPKDYYEAAQIDGVKNKFQEMAYITWPQMKPQLLFGAVNAIVGAFGVYDIAVTVGGNPSPENAALTWIGHLMDYAFTRFQMGYASAISFLLAVTTFTLGRICMRVFREKD